MADITLVKISALPAAEQIGAEDLLPVVQEGATKAVAYGVIKDDIAEELAPDATLSEAGKAADAKAVGDALALKADKTELTAEVSRIDAALNTKVNNTTYTAEVERIDGAIATKADAAATTAALATKANANDVTEALALKADAATVNAALATKANTTTVNSALAIKADKTELTEGLATKQNVLTFDSIPTEDSTNPVTSGGVYTEVAEIKNDLMKAASGRIIYVNGGKNGEVTDRGEASVIYSINAGGVFPQRSKKASHHGITFISKAGLGVNVSGTKETASTINRYYSENRCFDVAASAKYPAIISSGTSITISAAIVIHELVDGDVSVGAFDVDGRSLGRITKTETGFGSINVTVAAGEGIYLNIGVGQQALSVVDADIYITATSGAGIVENVGTSLALYDKTLVVSDSADTSIKYAGEIENAAGNMLEICAYNVGGFANGGSTPEGDNAMRNNFVKTFQESGNSVFLFSEWREKFNNTVTAEEAFGRLREHWTTITTIEFNNYVLQRTASQFTIAYEELKYFSNYYSENESRYFIDAVICMENGENLHIINTHLTWHSAEVRLAQVQEIIDYIADNGIKYAIVGGDFNQGSSRDVEPPTTQAEVIAYAQADVLKWTDAGFKSAQENIFGDFEYSFFINTSNNPTSDVPCKPYDNIVITPTLSFLNVKVITNGESDHKALYASVLID